MHTNKRVVEKLAACDRFVILRTKGPAVIGPVPPIFSIRRGNLGISTHRRIPSPAWIRQPKSSSPSTARPCLSRAAFPTEILALRQQVAVLKRERPRYTLRTPDTRPVRPAGSGTIVGVPRTRWPSSPLRASRGLIRAGFWAWLVVVKKAPPGITVPSPSLSVCLAHGGSDLRAVCRDCLAVPTAEKEMMPAQM